MRTNPHISIIMPAYGVEDFISNAIESVLQQSYNGWELLVINDGGKDNSRAIAKQYESKDSRIKVLDKDNGGLSDARNFGLKFAGGEYVHFFDSDDYIEPDFYEKMLDAVNKRSNDFVVCGYYVDHISNQGVRYDIHEFFDSDCPIPANYNLHSLGEYFNFAWNKLFRRSFLQKNSLLYQKGLYGYEDVEFMSRVIDYNPKFTFVRYPGYHYCNRKRETLSKVFDDKLLDNASGNLECYKKILNYFCSDNQNVKSEFQRAVRGMFKSLLPLAMMQKKRQLSKIHLITSSAILSPKLQYVRNVGIGDFVLCLFVKNKFDILIYLFYRFRKK